VFITGVALGVLIGAPLGFFLSSLLLAGSTEVEYSRSQNINPMARYNSKPRKAVHTADTASPNTMAAIGRLCMTSHPSRSRPMPS